MNEKLHVLLDTNIYSWFFEGNQIELIQKVAESHKLQVYGFSVIRKELRATPHSIYHAKMNYRNQLISTYDQITSNHVYGINEKIEELATVYAEQLRNDYQKKMIWNDLLIISCASVHALDIVVSRDKRTMFSELMKEIYIKVNQEKKLKIPKFYSEEDLKKLVQ